MTGEHLHRPMGGGSPFRHSHLRLLHCVALCALIAIVAGPSGCCHGPDRLAAPTTKDYSRPLPEGMSPLVRVTDAAEYPDFRRAFLSGSAAPEALDESLAYFAKPSSRRYYPYQTNDREITHDMQVKSLESLREVYATVDNPEAFARAIHERFDVYKSVGWDAQSGEVLFTGYYTPIFDGRLAPDDEFRHPLYKRPPDLITAPDGTPRGRLTPDGDVVSYPARAEIEQQGLLAGSELVYLRDPFEVYIVHVQGSARIRLEDNRILHVGYAGKTDRPYRPIGEELIRRGKLRRDELSLARLRRYFAEHPEDLPEVLATNESYVFFAESEPGPFGSIGQRVTPLHTIATDKSIFPRGSFVVVDTRIPMPAHESAVRQVSHVGVYFDQDTGGAIRSAGRADLYLGVGAGAEQVAGYTRSEGRLYYLFLKESEFAHLADGQGDPVAQGP